jgi:drug/metabolite transporter (DMT)-like permease
MAGISGRQYGIALVAASAVLWSTAGLFVRMAHLDTWTILGWRSLFSGITLGGFAFFRNRHRVLAAISGIGRPGIASVLISAVSGIAYVVALKLTTVANVMTIYAALPFITAAIAFLWRRERVNRQFAIACSITLLGIVIMTGASANPKDLAGIGAAIIMTGGFASQLVHTKHHASLDMAIISAFAAVCTGLIAIPLMQFGIPSPVQLLACALFGILTTGFAYILVVNGGRYLASGEAAFISLLDVILGPLWVWLFFSETPSPAVLLGGMLVLISVAWYLLRGQAPEPSALLPE